MTDLLVRGGTVVTVGRVLAGRRRRRRRADHGGRARPRRARRERPGGRRRDRAARAPGRRRRAHAHAGRERRRAGPVLRRLGGRGVRRHDDVPLVQQPGHGLVRGRGAIAARPASREWLAATSGDSAVDVGLSAVISSSHEDPVADLPHLVDGGVPTFKAFMVYDFGVDDATLLGAAGRRVAAPAGMLEVHCENRTILDALTARHLAAGETGPAVPREPRGRRTSRPRRPAGRSPWRGPRGRRCTSSTSRRPTRWRRSGPPGRPGSRCSPRRAPTT